MSENLFDLLIGSPAYAGTPVVHIKTSMGAAHQRMGVVGHRNQDDGYGKTEGQLGSMPEGDVDAVIDVNAMFGEPSEPDDLVLEAMLRKSLADTARRRAAEQP